MLLRCESCGAALAGSLVEPDSQAAARAAADAELDRLFEASENGARGELRAANRASLQAWIGEGSWAGLELPERPLVLTPRALEALLERRGLALERARFPVLGRNQLWMWQTMINALTFHPNFARRVLDGRLRPLPGIDRLTFAVDVVVTVLAAPLVALVSFPLETVAALARRGGEMRGEVVAGQLGSSARVASSSAASS